MDAISAELPDVVLLDVMLPQISGLELAAQVRSKDPKLPIIFITAADDSDTAIEAMRARFAPSRAPLTSTSRTPCPANNNCACVASKLSRR